jgi:hypothetical protein
MPGFTLKGKIQLDGSQWKAGLAQAKGQASKWSTEVTSMIKGRMAAAFGIYGVFRAASSSIDRGGEVRDKSKSLGIDPELYQQIDFAASQSGASIDDAAKAIKRLAVAQVDARRGSKDLLEAFGRYGLTVKELERLSPEKLFFLISEQVENGVNKMGQLADMQKLLGRSGASLIPAFEAGFGKTAQSAIDLGTVIPTGEIMELAAAGDKLLTASRVIGKEVAGVVASGAKGADGAQNSAALSSVVKSLGFVAKEDLRTLKSVDAGLRSIVNAIKSVSN